MQTSQRRISLRLHAAGMITLVLVVITVLTQFIQYQRMLSLREEQLGDDMDKLGQSFIAIMNQSGIDLQRLASLLAIDIERIRGAKQFDLSQAIFFSGIEAIQFLGPGGNRSFTWQLEGSSHLPSKALNRRALEDVGKDGRPRSYVECDKNCVMHAFLPILTRDGNDLVINVTRDISEPVKAFSLLADIDVIVLANAQPAAGKVGNIPLHWKKNVVLATNPDNTLPVLRSYAASQALPALDNATLQWINHRYIASLNLSLPDSLKASDINILLMLDQTDEIAGLRKRAVQDIAVAVIGAILTGLLLGMVLGGPLGRMLRIANAMPLLAEGEFDKLRKTIGPGRRNKASDEVDDLHSATLQLTDDLEALQKRVVENRQTLTHMVDDLTRARSFSDRLIDTAPLIIILHEPNGRIQRMNQFGHQTTGWRPNNVNGKDIGMLIPGKDALGMPRPSTNRSQTDSIKEYEGSLICANGSERKVYWMQAQVDADAGQVLLSVGLDLTKQRETESRLRWLSSHDVITQLPNREQLAHEFIGCIRDAQGGSYSVALILVDIDQLQDINDTHGLQEGDRALKAVGDCLKQNCPNLFVSRSGGDEFTVLMPGADGETALRTADSLCKAISQISFECSGKPVSLSTSVGVALFPEHGKTTEEINTNASVALAQAKRLSPGRARLVQLDEEVHAVRERRIRMRAEINQAIADDRFLLHFQPILHLHTGRISHAEVLVRMRSPDGKLIPPYEFISVAEQTGQIAMIDRLVLQKALKTQAEAMRQGHSLKLGINVSAKSFEDAQYFQDFSSAVNQSGADPKQIIIEILETEAIASFDSAQKVVRRIKEFGSHFALDDFGIGFTSFEYLRELPVSYVKIDQSFVKHLKDRPQDRELVRSMNEMIHRLGILSVAEGVEDKEALDFLREIGVDYGQGYYISRPLAAAPIGDVASEIESRITKP